MLRFTHLASPSLPIAARTFAVASSMSTRVSAAPLAATRLCRSHASRIIISAWCAGTSVMGRTSL
uniref:Secreted protein n=1 Tax=Decurrovirus sp. TaxID=2832697 RepID=A0AAU8HXG4_9CAUD